MSSGARGRNVLKHAQEERSTVFVFATLHSHQMEGEIAVDWEELMRLEIVQRRVAQSARIRHNSVKLGQNGVITQQSLTGAR